MLTQAEKAQAFHALHHQEGAFLIPNPWDPGTARLLAHALALDDDAVATLCGHLVPPRPWTRRVGPSRISRAQGRATRVHWQDPLPM